MTIRGATFALRPAPLVYRFWKDPTDGGWYHGWFIFGIAPIYYFQHS